MWQMVVQGIVGAVEGYNQASVNKSITDINNRLDAANASNTNKVRQAGNAFSAAKGALQRYIQSLQNNQALEAGGEALEQNLVNARRHEDANLQGGFEQSIRSSEQLGSQAAAAAFAGVGGEVADTVSMATRLSHQRASHAALRNTEFRSYDTARRASSIMSQTVRSLDSSLILDTLDYNSNVAQPKASLKPWYGAVAGATQAILGSGVGNSVDANKSDTDRSSQNRQAFQASERRDSYYHSIDDSQGSYQDFRSRERKDDSYYSTDYSSNDYGAYF